MKPTSLRVLALTVVLMMILLVAAAPIHAQRVTEPVPPWNESSLPDLSETSTTDDGSLIVFHPNDWSATIDEDQLTFASSDRLLNDVYPFNLRREGDFRAGIFVLDQGSAGRNEESVLLMLTDVFMEIFEDDDLNYDFETPQPLELGGRSAVMVIGRSDDLDQLFLVVSMGDGYYANIVFFTTPGSAEQFIGIAEAIGGAMEYFPEEISPEDKLNEA